MGYCSNIGNAGQEALKLERLIYTTPAVRVVDTHPQRNFLQSGGEGNIDPGTDDPWGEF